MLLSASSPAKAQSRTYDWAAARYEATLLDDGSDPWHLSSLEAGTRRERVSGIARLNHAARFAAQAFQLEVDAYPSWPGRGYAYLSAGYGAGAPFPRLRLAGEAYAVLPRAFEVSVGGTYLDFEDDEVPIVTGALGKYSGNYWFSLRPYWLPDRSDFSIGLTARRYFATADDYVTLRLVRGSSPENLLVASDAERLQSVGVHADAQIRVGGRWLILPRAGLMSEELSGDRRRTRTSLGFGVSYRFGGITR